MIETNYTVGTARKTRTRAMIIPHEHGAWGLLLVPLFTGVVAGFAPEHRIGSLMLFTTAALSLFALRTPAESLLGIGAIPARTSDERLTTLIASTCLASLAAACLGFLMWRGQRSALLVFGAIGGCAFLGQIVLRRLSRDTRMISQIVGAIALTSTAPAAYYIGAGRVDERAVALWIANWIFTGNQIHFVQLRIHAARATTFTEKFARGQFFLVAQAVFLIILTWAAYARVVPSLSIIAFVPAVARGIYWFFRKAEPLDVNRLGWSEMKQGVAFGILLAVAFCY